jgi:hypothetical protein
LACSTEAGYRALDNLLNAIDNTLNAISRSRTEEVMSSFFSKLLMGHSTNFDRPEADRAEVRLFETVNSHVFVEGRKKEAPRVPPDYGEHTREILNEAGYSGAEVERLLQSGAAIANPGSGSRGEPHTAGQGAGK